MPQTLWTRFATFLFPTLARPRLFQFLILVSALLNLIW
ncbi:unnamed protein product [Tuber melanosporum]|uniref:(Perigord truffle) hypothetical protein n=1 Tax=Tuber melanosporum (strain Mel28) TaxID=656061 RepID=D5GPZ9_TUBMM|nr:uncharacterized protein GSTUM_00012113001 [Tuber melanosporum]CAZ86592.1 unnamed protein product [Tuber melanosporum]